MKHINFKRYKFSTILKYINFKRFNFLKIYKYIDFRGYNFSQFLKYVDLRKYNYNKILKYVDFRKFNYSKFFKHINLTKYSRYYYYTLSSVFVLLIIYLSLPIFYHYDKNKIEKIVCNGLNVECLIQGDIKYNFFPTPRIKFENLVVQNLAEKKNILAKVQNAEIKVSYRYLYDKEKFLYNKILLKDAELNIDFNNLKELTKIFKNSSNKIKTSLKNGSIFFFDEDKNIANIENANFEYKISGKTDKAQLEGNFLGDTIFLELRNNKKEKKQTTIITLKLIDTRLFTKINILQMNLDKKAFNGNALLKLNKNRFTTNFNYEDSNIFFENSNLRNSFLDGQLNGLVKFFPYFNFNLNLDLNGINFNKFVSILNSFDNKNLFKISKKINGQLNLSTNKVYSKYNFVNSFESRIKFINGNILIDQLLLSLGKLGAADITGIVKNEKQFTNFNFENNIYIDNLKKFYNKFGIYNKEKIPSNLFVAGNLDLVNLNMRFNEISSQNKFNNEDIAYFEKEFNNILLEDGYKTFFNFLNLKDFVKSITTETN